MARRRMMSLQIAGSDAFLDLPLTSQCLYFHLCLRADDDGFIDNYKQIMRLIGAAEDDFKLLLAKRFLLAFDNNIFVVKHWWIHNTMQKDRYHKTVYQDEYKLLKIKENQAYSFNDNKMITECYQNDNNLITETKLNKTKLNKLNNISVCKFVPPTLEEVKAYCSEKGYSIDCERFIDFYTSKGWMVGKNKMKDWKASVRTWVKSSKPIANSKTDSKKENARVEEMFKRFEQKGFGI